MFVLYSVTRLLCNIRLEPFPSSVHILDLRHLNIRFSEPLLTDLIKRASAILLFHH